MKRCIPVVLMGVSLVACNDWLTEPSPGTTSRSDYFTSGITAVYVVNAVYVPMAWEFNTENVYYSEYFIGDVASDDALKGGENVNDQRPVYFLENFQTITNNELLLDFFRAQYQGVARCNLALDEVPKVKNDSILTPKLQERLIGEALFMRAFYYFRLLRVFGGVPLVDFVVESSKDWNKPRASIEETYDFILRDLEAAEPLLWSRGEYQSPEDDGRATKGAAQSLLLKVNLYKKDYQEAVKWGKKVVESGDYVLIDDYSANFTVAGENGPESVFEIQYAADPNSDFGKVAQEGGNGYTRGTFTTVMTRSRSSKIGGSLGWGLNKPTQDLYDEFEDKDLRRDIAIYTPADNLIDSPEKETYLGSKYLNGKYSMYIGEDFDKKLSHESRGELNYKLIRYADVLLMYAEACTETDDLSTAVDLLNQVRERARNYGTDPDILPSFPYGNYTVSKDDLHKAIRHERRVELAMEGHRWFDLCRWGIAAETMNAYRKRTSEVQGHMSEFIEGKHELFPIPSKEIDLNPAMKQNNGY